MKSVAISLTVALLGGALGAGFAGVIPVAAASPATHAAAAALIQAPAEAPAVRLADHVTAVVAHDEEAKDNDEDADDKDKDKDKDKTKHGATLDRIQAVLDRLVKDGLITPDQGQKIREALKDALAKKPEQSRAGEFRFTGAIFKVVQEYLGVTQKEIQANAKAGKSLADLAVASGKTRDALIIAIVTSLDPAVDKTKAAAAVGTLVDQKGHLNAGRDKEDKPLR